VVCATLTFVCASVALRYLSPSVFHASRGVEPTRESVETSRNLFLATQQAALREMEGRPVYPYSIVRGGIRNAQELKRAAEHDPVVASHYAGFDYDHARVVRLVLARTAYVSYRIGNRVYWTRRRVKLKKGETLLTDGKITARTRCANRVEEMPQQATSESEPPVAKFDEPMMPSLGPAMQAPSVPFESSLASGNPGPAPPLTSYDPITTEGWTPISPPPLPSVCGIGKKKSGEVGGGKKKFDPCGSSGPPGEVPEPSTWLLMASGAGAIYWKARQKFARRRPS